MLIIYVTEVELASEKKADCKNCAISTAINKVLPEGWFASTGYESVTIHPLNMITNSKGELVDSSIYHIPLPPEVQICIKLYDEGHANMLKPFCFSLPISIVHGKVIKDGEVHHVI